MFSVHLHLLGRVWIRRKLQGSIWLCWKTSADLTTSLLAFGGLTLLRQTNWPTDRRSGAYFVPPTPRAFLTLNCRNADGLEQKILTLPLLCSGQTQCQEFLVLLTLAIGLTPRLLFALRLGPFPRLRPYFVAIDAKAVTTAGQLRGSVLNVVRTQ